jgi:hypothetical protein
MVWNNEIKININDSAKTAAGVTSPRRAVKGKEIGDRVCVRNLACCTFKPVTESQFMARHNPEVQAAFSKQKGLLQGVHDPLPLRGSLEDPVCYNMDFISAF